MCGICGVAYADPARPVERALLERMSAAITHRGPDSAGFHFAPGIGLAARRLSIIDLVHGDQPVSNEDGTVVVVFNGEIYNYPELRPALQARGHRFRGGADTEAIVHLYEEYGDDCVDHLRGMFAFALWDARSRRLLLARDRVGKKPLYYEDAGGDLAFGSEIKTLLRGAGGPRRVEPQAVHHYLTLQYVPEPLTAFCGIRQLPPGHRLVWHEGRCTVERYWDLDYEPKLEGSPEELGRRVRETVTEAVRVRLMSDVPLGAHLSGGIDSTIVVGVMAGVASQPVRTFSIGFNEDAWSELPHARTIAERFRTEHHEFVVTPDALELLPRLVEHFDEPFADAAAIPLWHLARVTREHVTVALNGDGGDEAFAGYQRYYADAVADAYRLVPAAVRTGIIDPLLTRLPTRTDIPLERSYVGALRRLAQAGRSSSAASVLRWGSFFGEAEKWALYSAEAHERIRPDPSAALLEVRYHGARARTRLDRTLYTDLHEYLPGALLVKADRMSMAHSLEARSPLLDQEVLALAARLPTRFKVQGRATKRILRTAFADLLPPAIARRPKMGFGVPLGAWLAGPLLRDATQLLLAPDARSRRWLRPEAVQRLLRENAQGRADHGKRIWALLNLEQWLRSYAGDLCD